MFETLRNRCSAYNFPHDSHEWREGFLWLSKKRCDGIPEEEDLWRIPVKTVNQHRAEAGLPTQEEVGSCGKLDAECTCSGKPYVKSDYRKDAKIPPTPHKHMYRFAGVIWQDRMGRPLTSRYEQLEFYCERCPDQNHPAEVKVERWKYRDMTMNLSRTERTWPQ